MVRNNEKCDAYVGFANFINTWSNIRQIIILIFAASTRPMLLKLWVINIKTCRPWPVSQQTLKIGYDSNYKDS